MSKSIKLTKGVPVWFDKNGNPCEGPSYLSFGDEMDEFAEINLITILEEHLLFWDTIIRKAPKEQDPNTIEGYIELFYKRAKVKNQQYLMKFCELKLRPILALRNTRAIEISKLKLSS